MTLRPGDLLGHYTLEKNVSSSSMSEVWTALDHDDHLVMLKTLHPQAQKSQEAHDRLHREGDCSARIVSARVCRLLDRGEEAGLPFLVFEKLEGRTLADALLEAGTLSRASFLSLAEDLLEALADVHAAGILHRDVKPQNLFVTHEGTTKLLDFGIARATSTADLTTQGTTLGSLAYAAPEQMRSGTTLDARADLYSAGVVLFESIAGRTPFRAPNAAAIVALKMAAKAPSLEDVMKKPFPKQLEVFLAALLAKAPSQRWASAMAALEALSTLPEW